MRRLVPPSSSYSGILAALPRMSHSAMSMPESARQAPAPRPWLLICMRCTRGQAPMTSVASTPSSRGCSVLWMRLTMAPGLRPGWASP